jgi:probable HAF family extracellular repeat protein
MTSPTPVPAPPTSTTPARCYRFGGPPLGNQRNYVRNPDGTLRLLPTPAGADYAEAAAINNRGDAVGHAWFPAERDMRAVYWPAAGGVQRLADLPDVNSWGGFAINDSGQVVGLGHTTATAADRQRALLWDTAAGTVIDLGTLPGMSGAQAAEVNNAGEVVGGSGRGFLWTPTEGMLDLTSLLDASGQGWQIHFAHGINNRGQIAATGLFNDVPLAVLLTPVPEPAALMLLPLAGFLLLRRRHIEGANKRDGNVPSRSRHLFLPP